MALIIGFLMSIIILLTWFLFEDTIDKESMIAQLESTGLTDIHIYLAAMIYWIFLNSLLEEYLFRWFVTTKAIDLLGNEIARNFPFSIAIHLTSCNSPTPLWICLVANSNRMLRSNFSCGDMVLALFEV